MTNQRTLKCEHADQRLSANRRATSTVSPGLVESEADAWSILSGVLTAYALLALMITVWLFSGAAQAQAEETPRIVAIDGSLSEIVFALGKGDELVGRDTTSSYPKAATERPSVGYMRQLSAEGILSLKPTLVLATQDAKPQRVLTRLKDAGVAVEVIDNVYTPEGVAAKIKRVTAILQVPQKGTELIRKMRQSVAQATREAQQAAEQMGKPKSAIFVLNMRGGNMMVAGQGTRADEMLQLARVVNPAADAFKGYKPLTAEAAIQYNPSVLITMSHGLSASGGRDAMLDTPAIQMTEAGQQGRLLVMDDSFLTFGPRLGEAIASLVQQVYGKD
ncbi:MAG: heme/hemin ABC transporter substrate-binding protein [Hydrogenovibrio sp.]